LQVKDDPGHAFYLGVELARAEVAWQLGKRYTQDEDLHWGCAVKQEQEDLTQQKAEGTTMKKRDKDRACGSADKPLNTQDRGDTTEKPKNKQTRACGTAEPSKKKKERPCGTADKSDT
jgi:hypothetical protein